MITTFQEKDLQDVAEALHHLVRYISFTGVEFCVRFEQRPPKSSSRRPVTNELTLQQVNSLFDSVEKARAFLAPIHQRRDFTDGKTAQQ